MYGGFTKATDSIGEWLVNKVNQAGNFGKATLEEIASIFGGRSKFDPKQPTNSPVLKTGQAASDEQVSLDDIAQSGAITSGNASSQAEQSAAQEAKKKGVKPETASSGIVQQANAALKKVAEIGAGMGIDGKAIAKSAGLNNSYTDLSSLMSKQGMQNMQPTFDIPAASNGTATDTKQDESAVKPQKKSEQKTYTATGYGFDNPSDEIAGGGQEAARMDAEYKLAQMSGKNHIKAVIVAEGKNSDGRYYSKMQMTGAYPINSVLLFVGGLLYNLHLSRKSGRYKDIFLSQRDEAAEKVWDFTMTNDPKDISLVSKQLIELGKRSGLESKSALILGLAVEEMAVYTRNHMHTKEYIDILARLYKDRIEIDFRSLGESFNPNVSKLRKQEACRKSVHRMP